MDVSYGAMNPINILEGIQNSYDTRASQVKFNNTKAFQMFATRIRKFGDQVNCSNTLGSYLHNIIITYYSCSCGITDFFYFYTGSK